MTDATFQADPFVGRDTELARIERELERVLLGQGRLLLLAGDPGIGKTRLADQAGAIAAERGARVVWGRCWQGSGAPAYWLWIQILRQLVQDFPDDASGRAEPGLADIRSLLLDPSGPESHGPGPNLDPEQARFRFFETVTSFLRACAHRQPLVLVLDDLHWATRSSLLLLRHVARSLRDMPVLIVATYRDSDVRLSPEISELVADLLRDGERLLLNGLSKGQVAEFVERLARGFATSKLVDSIYRLTEGNPFFVDEVVRMILAESHARSQPYDVTSEPRLPDEVRDVIRRRLEPLSPAVRHLLATASVIGRAFDAALLAEAVGEGAGSAAVAAPLDEAIRAGTLTPAADAPGRYTFTHGLIRDFLYDELSDSQRREVHLRVGHALAESAASGARLAEIAHHLCRAAPDGDLAVAVDYAERAGREALRSLAYEEAAECFAEALRAIAFVPDDAPGKAVELRLALADARWRFGDTPNALDAFSQAAALARRGGLDELFVEAVLGLGRVKIERASLDRDFVTLLREALGRCPAERPLLRIRLLARLTTALQYGGDSAERARLAEQAVELARSLRDPASLAIALGAQHNISWEADAAHRRAVISEEIVGLAHQHGDIELELSARQLLLADRLTLGDLATADRDIELFAELAEKQRVVRHRRYAMVFRAMRSLMAGRLREGEALVEDALRARELEPSPSSYYLTQLVLLRYEQGRIGETIAGLEAFARRSPEQPLFRCGLAFAYAEGGETVAAREAFERLARFAFLDFSYDANWLLSLSLLGHVCFRLGDEARARTLYQLLAPAADAQIVVVGGVAYWGSVSFVLGLLASVCGRSREALAHFDRAIEQFEALGAASWKARTLFHRGVVRLSTDRASALEDFECAERIAKDLGLGGLLARLSETPRAAVVAARRDDGAGGAEFRRSGDIWSLSYCGERASIEDSKGMRYLEHLLRHAGTEFHATELATLSQSEADSRDRRVLRTLASSDAGEVLDARAAADYKRRIRDLQEELDEAERHGDLGRAESLTSEVEFLTRELAGGLGLGGRRRKAGSPAERARVSVTKGIRGALERLRVVLPALADHLDRTVKTGTFCVYQDDRDQPVDWRWG